MVIFRALQVKNGDCFMLLFPDYKKPQLLIIDSGFVGTFRKLEENLYQLMEKYDCDIHMLLTHIDQDHIGGFKSLFGKLDHSLFRHIVGFYYNTLESLKVLDPFVTKEMISSNDVISTTTKTSYNDAMTLETFLKEHNIPVYTGFYANGRIDFCESIFAQVLSPSQASLAKYKNWICTESERKTDASAEDYCCSINDLAKRDFETDDNPVNASSISFLLNAFDCKMLFLGDSLPADVAAGLRALGYSEERPLHVDLVKVSHHGSRHNTSPELLKLIRGERFLISGQGVKGHPDKETLARIICLQEEPLLLFNYDISNDIFTPQEIKDFCIRTETQKEWRL